MICYKDISWCGSPNCKNECDRKLQGEELERYHKWSMRYFGGRGEGPIAQRNFCDENGNLKNECWTI